MTESYTLESSPSSKSLDIPEHKKPQVNKTKVKQIKSISKETKDSRGRPKAIIDIEKLAGKSKFTVRGLAEKRKVSVVTMAKEVNRLKDLGKVKLVDKIMHSSNKGQPLRYFVYDKNGKPPKKEKVKIGKPVDSIPEPLAPIQQTESTVDN